MPQDLYEMLQIGEHEFIIPDIRSGSKYLIKKKPLPMTDRRTSAEKMR
jgi:hypothetical protein